MSKMTGGRALVEMLRRNNIDTLFVIPGVQNDGLFSALFDFNKENPDRAIRVIHTRHEQGAAYMALGYARSSGRVGAYAVVPGPGFLNTTAALTTAYGLSAPVLCITGQIATSFIGRGIGQLHELPDQLAILRGLTKWAMRIEHPTQAPSIVNEAFRQLHSGRPRPVGLEIPLDVLENHTDVALTEGANAPAPIAPDASAIQQAVELLKNAKHPLMFVGSGAENASAEVRQLADMLQMPVTSVSAGFGVMSDKHPLSIHGPVAHRLWKDADVVFAVGTRLMRPLMDWGHDANLKIIRVDIDPTEVARQRKPEISIVADAKETLKAVIDGLQKSNFKAASRTTEITTLKEEFDELYAASLVPQYDIIHEMRRAMPEDGIFVDEMTQVGYAARYLLPTYEPRKLITSGYQGTLGYGFATALGVKVANPDKPVVSFNGDGGIMFTIQELATAVQHKINLVSVVFADQAFGNVLRMQQQLHGGRVIATHLDNPDFVKLAESFGAVGMRVHTAAELGSAIAKGLTLNKPVLIEMPVGEMGNPQKFMGGLQKVRG